MIEFHICHLHFPSKINENKTLGYDNQFPSPTFLLGHAVRSSKDVAQEKIIG